MAQRKRSKAFKNKPMREQMTLVHRGKSLGFSRDRARKEVSSTSTR